jgi:hypothetical protein
MFFRNFDSFSFQQISGTLPEGPICIKLMPKKLELRYGPPSSLVLYNSCGHGHHDEQKDRG